MLAFESVVVLEGVTGEEITAFLLECDDARYQAWWPGTHRAFHVVDPGPTGNHVGDRVWMDEVVGRRHLRMSAVVREAVPGRRIGWQLRPWRLPVPVRVTLDLEDTGRTVRLTHRLTAGWTGPGRILDPGWRRYLDSDFADALDQHVHTEFSRLRALLHPEGGPLRPGSPPRPEA